MPRKPIKPTHTDLTPSQFADLLVLAGEGSIPALEPVLQAYVQECMDAADPDESQCIDTLTEPKQSLEWEQLGRDFARAIQFANDRESFMQGFQSLT